MSKNWGLALGLILAGCAASGEGDTFGNQDGSGNGSDNGDGGGGDAGTGNPGDVGPIDDSGDTTDGGDDPVIGDPKTCEQAAKSRSYVGCDFWPTVTTNLVWDVFDFVVAVANAGDNPANVEVRRGGAVVQTAQVPPNGLQKIYLPWIPILKGPQADSCGGATPITESIYAPKGAFHLTSDTPVTVYQFNALQYQGKGGPPGKSWASCPGLELCPQYLQAIGCFSFSNDASLLLPSTTLTNTYRVFGVHGGDSFSGIGSYIAITATQDQTSVRVQTSPTGNVLAGGKLSAFGANQEQTFTLDNAGDVVEVVAPGGADLSGSLVISDKPVQVIAGSPCINTPSDVPACDHIEESIFPAETLGTRYLVNRPSGPLGGPVNHVVKLYGNFNNTQLTYPGATPSGAPTVLQAGQVVDLGRVSTDFEVVADQAFGVGMFMIGADEISPGQTGDAKGDPSLTLASSVEQFRTKYVFLAPDDYDVNFVDISMPVDAQVVLDGNPVSGTPVAMGSGEFGILRVSLGTGQGGAHSLTSDKPVGIQVMGYGAYTSYHYPGGLDLQTISEPPAPR